MFVPTTEGNSLCRAESVLARTNETPPGDLSACNAQAADRRQMSQDFWRFAEVLRNAERNWLSLTIKHEIAEAEKERIGDPQAALARLRQVKTTLSGTEHYGQFSGQVTHARRQALEAQAADTATAGPSSLQRCRR